MAKKENLSFSMPVAPPPGFEPLNSPEEVAFCRVHDLQQHASSSSNIEAEQSVDKNIYNNNNILRRTTRKIVPPKVLYVPQAAPVVPSRRRGRPPKAKSVVVSQQHSSLQQEGTIGLDKVSSTPETRPEEPNTSVLLYAKGQPNLRKHKQLVEETSGVKIARSAYHEDQHIYVDRNPTNTTHASVSRDQDVEQMRSPISGDHRIKNLGLNNQLCHNIDSSILHQVEIDQNHLARDDPKTKLRSSELDVNLTKILDAINNKYGDITRNCLLESDFMKTFVSLGICKMVQNLQNKRLKDVDMKSLDSYYTAVRDAENLKVNVQWLRKRLDEIKDAHDKEKSFVAERNKRIANILVKNEELVSNQLELSRLGSKIRDIEDELARETVMVDELNRNINAQNSSRFQHHSSLMDGLI